MRETPYAREIATAKDVQGQAIERLYIKEHGCEEIRFSWWKDGNLIMRPLDLPEDELLDLLGLALTKKVFTEDFLRSLQGMLNRHLRDE